MSEVCIQGLGVGVEGLARKVGSSLGFGRSRVQGLGFRSSEAWKIKGLKGQGFGSSRLEGSGFRSSGVDKGSFITDRIQMRI